VLPFLLACFSLSPPFLHKGKEQKRGIDDGEKCLDAEPDDDRRRDLWPGKKNDQFFHSAAFLAMWLWWPCQHLA